MDFDYYQIKGKWNAATVSRRIDKLEEAERAADELEDAGAIGVEVIGVKAGKRETLRGKRAKKAAPAKTTAKKKKAYTAPKMKVKEQEKPNTKKAAPKKKKVKRTKSGIKVPPIVQQIRDESKKIEKYKVKSIDDVKNGLDPWDYWDENYNANETINFTPEDCALIANALDYYEEGEGLYYTFAEAQTVGRNSDIEMTGYEIALTLRALDNLLNMQKTDYYKDHLRALIIEISGGR